MMLAGVPTLPARAMLGFEEPQEAARTQAVLYFRYLGSQWLGQEERQIQVRHTESLEQALVQALLDGPRNREVYGQSLFPSGTRVLNVLAEGRRLFVTFSKEIMYPLPGENAGVGRAEAVRRRTLAMASLVNTLTESGNFSSVQVLVLDDPGISNSMRLSLRYYLEESADLPAPLSRSEDSVITPGEAAAQIISRWKSQQWRAFSAMLAIRPSELADLTADLSPESLPPLVDWAFSPGTTSPGGRYAVVLASLRLKPQGSDEISLQDIPLVMLQEGQGWHLSRLSLQLILELLP